MKQSIPGPGSSPANGPCEKQASIIDHFSLLSSPDRKTSKGNNVSSGNTIGGKPWRESKQVIRAKL